LLSVGLLYLIVFTVQNIRQNKELTKWVNNTHFLIETIHDVHANLLEVESRVRGYAITGNEVFIKDYAEKSDLLLKNIARLQKQIDEDPHQTKDLEQLMALAKQKLQWQEKIIQERTVSQDAAEKLITSLTGKKLTDEMINILQRVEIEEQALLTNRMKESDRLTAIRNTTFIVLATSAFVILAMLMLRIIREVRMRRFAQQKAEISESKYRGLIENSALVVYTMDLECNFSYVSGQCKNLTGFSADDLVGESLLTIVEEGWRQKVQDFYTEQQEKQTFETNFEFPIVSKNGHLFWIEQSVVLLYEGGEPVGFQSIAKDVTERNYAKKLLAESEQRIKAKQEEYQERLQAILDNMPMFVYLKDTEGRFIMVNKQFHQTFGTTDEDVIGNVDVNVHVNESGAKKFAEADEEVKRTRRPVEVEDLVVTTEGERNMLIIKFPLFDKNNELFAISAVGKDITELVRYQRQLITARLRAEKAERLQEEFLANMSHEIRTPMNGIIGMANLLETTTLSSEQRDYLHLIQESSGILLSLINNILDLSKIKSGRMSVECADFDLHQTIDSILAPFSLKAKEKSIALNKIYQDLPRYIRGDQQKLQQILNNLLSNAVKFTQQGGVTLFATTEEREGDALFLVISVTDTGIGISPENQEQVFESFVQGGTDMVRRFGGTGLGLAITKRLIEMQGGKIDVSSTPGEGTSFYLELPLVLSNGIAEPAAADLEKSKEISTQSVRGKSVLLIEDNLVNQKVTYLMLHKAGMRVDIAGNGKEAVELLQQKTYDLIITDLQMPEMDGFQTTAFIRNKLQLTTPIIAMTASALRNEKDRCMELGMNEYLTKPFAPATLFFHLKRFLLHDETKQAITTGNGAEEKREELYNLGFLEEMEDEEYTAEVLNLFLSSTPVSMSELKDASIREDWSEVHKKAHSLKSSLGILQMNTLLRTVTEIEDLAKNKTNTDHIDHLIQQAIRQYNLIKPMLEAELKTIS